MAGAYVGLGIILIFTLGNLLDPSYVTLVIGATFGIALTLVIIRVLNCLPAHHVPDAGRQSEHYQPRSNVTVSCRKLARRSTVGSVFVALLYSWGGGGLLPVDTSIVHSVARWRNHRARHGTVLQRRAV